MRPLILAGVTAGSLVATLLAQTSAAPRAASATVTLASSVTALAARGGSRGVAAGMADGSVALWNGRDAAPETTLKPHASRVVALGSTAKGEILSLSDDGGLARVAAGGAAPIVTRLVVGQGPIRAAAFSADGAMVATGGERGELRIFEMGTGSLRRTIQGHRTELHSLAIRPGSSVVASASAEGDLRIWDVATGRQLVSSDLDLALFALAFSPRDGALASGGVGRRLTFHDPDDYRARHELQLGRPRMVATLAWSPDGRLIAVGDIDDGSLTKGGIELVQADSRAVVATLDTGGITATAVVFASNEMVVGAIDKDLRSWQVR